MRRGATGIERGLVAKGRYIAGAMAGALVAAGAVAVPALGAPDTAPRAVRKAAASRVAGAFTPSSADPRLAALFARGGLDTSNFRFTPSDQRNGNRAVTVAVRARSNQAGRDAARLAAVGGGTVGLAPIAYNLGVSVGWKRFAVTSDLAKVDLAGAPGSREAADLAVSYAGKKVSGRIAASADRALPGATHLVEEPSSYALDVGGSYSLTRNLALTAGIRYKSERDRLTRLDDDRRDSQAVYVGTAFKF